MNFISNKNLGFDKENILIIENGDQLGQRAEVLKNELLRNPELIDVAFSQTIPSQLFYSSVCTPEGEDGVDQQEPLEVCCLHSS